MTNHPKQPGNRISSPSILEMPQDIITRAQQNVLKACQRGKIRSTHEAALILMALGLDTARPPRIDSPRLNAKFQLPEFLT